MSRRPKDATCAAGALGGSACGRPAKVRIAGTDYCNLHNPDKVAARTAANLATRAAKRDERMARLSALTPLTPFPLKDPLTRANEACATTGGRSYGLGQHVAPRTTPDTDSSWQAKVHQSGAGPRGGAIAQRVGSN